MAAAPSLTDSVDPSWDDGSLAEDVLGTENRSWWRSLSRPQLIAAVLALVVAIVLVVAGHLGSGAAHSRPGIARPVPTGLAFQPLDASVIDPNCPPTLECTKRESVPAATNEAVGQFLPGGTARRTVTLDRVDDGRLYYRAVNATAGLLELLVLVTTPDSAPAPLGVALDPHPGAAIRYVRMQIGRYEVQVQYTGPPGGSPPLDLARQLAADPRLLAKD